MQAKTFGRSTAISRAVVLRHVGRFGLSLGIMAICLALLAQRLTGFDPAQLHLAFMAVTGTQWAVALCAVAVSYLAMGQYDVLILRHLQLKHPEPRVRRAGVTALAISQTVGLGVLSGALVRWRMLPSLRFAEALRITLSVSLSFLLAAAVVMAVILLALGLQEQHGLAHAILGAAALLVGLCLVRPQMGSWRWPNLFTLFGMISLTAIDVTAAGAALWVLLPMSEIGFASLLPVFMVALLAGMICGTPAGLGAFELVLLTQLGTSDAEALLAAVMAWRLVYFAVPSLLALPMLAWGAAPETQEPEATDDPVRPVAGRNPSDRAFKWNIDWPEAGLLHQGHLVPLPIGQARAMVVGRTGHALIGMGGTRPQDAACALTHLRKAARSEGRLPVLYKIPARIAAHARQQGLRVTRIGAEAIVRPSTFSLNIPARAGLRRKLRKARAAGVQVTVCGPVLPPALPQIAATWAAHHGGERGFSMGRFCPRYLTHQRVYLARHEGREVAFISLHVTDRVWTLDLMRHAGAVPDGAMHLLVARAIEDAHLSGAAEVNLAAVPLGVNADAPTVFRRLAHLGGGAGLWQFKSAFMPQWRPLYLAAPRAGGTWLAALCLIRAIHLPPKQPQIQPPPYT